jgi:phosphotriesterase-related protein
MIRELKTRRLLHRVLLSHDGGWYSHGVPYGGAYRPHTLFFDLLLPELKRYGFTDDDIDLLMIGNPATAYRIRIRRP